MSSAITVSGTGFAISAAAPATNDATGFGALTYTTGDTCEIVDVGEIGFEWSTTETNTVCPEPNVRKKSSKTMKAFPLTLNYVNGDTMQEMLRVAYESATDVLSIQVSLPDGTKRWCTAQVTKLGETFGSKDDFITLPLEFEPQTAWIRG